MRFSLGSVTGGLSTDAVRCVVAGRRPGTGCGVGAAQMLREVLAGGGGVASRRELRRAGVGQRWVRRAILGGRLIEILPGVVADPRLRVDEWTRVRAAVLYAGDDAAVSHTSALWVWGLMQGQLGPIVHVSVPRPGVRSVQGVRVHQRSAGPVEVQRGLPVVAVRDALVGAAGLLDLDALRFPAVDAVMRRLVTASELADPAGVPRRNLRALRMVAEEAVAGAESGGEAKYWRLLKESDLPTPALQAEIRTHRGPKRVDAYWEAFRLAVEIDSREFHAKEGAFERDQVRQNAIHACGEVIIRFSVNHVMSAPTWVLEDTELNLRARGWSP